MNPGIFTHYEQTARRMRMEIRRGRWLPGRRLLSAGGLAEDFSVAPESAALAVTILWEEGYLYRRGNYFYVAARRNWPAPRNQKKGSS